MKTYILPSIKLTFITLFIFGVIYPLFVTSLAYVFAPNNGKGKTIENKGMLVGFELIGQRFDGDQYFNSRPSAVQYNAASTGGSNKGPTNQEYLEQVRARIDSFIVHNPGIDNKEIPVDLVTSSGGGLDPHLSPQAARIQVARIARARNMEDDVLLKLIEANTEYPPLKLGPPVVHILKLNIALDEYR